MQVKCAYCNEYIKAVGSTQGISHGICADCLPKALAEFEIPLTDYLEVVPYPAILVGDNGQIIAYNEPYREVISTSTHSAIDILDGETPPTVDNGFGIDADEQVNTVRKMVRQTLDTGEELDGRPATADVTRKVGRKRINLLVGTQRIGKNVIVGLESLSDSSV